MTVTVNDPQLLSELGTAGAEVELVDPAGRSLGVLTRPTAASGSNPVNYPAMTPAKVEAIIAAAKNVGEDPLFSEYLQAIKDYRREHNTVDDNE